MHVHHYDVCSIWYRCPRFSKDDSFMLPLQIVVREVFCFVEERETAGRHWKSVDLNDLSCIFTAHLAELKRSLTTVLYSQWDQLAQPALPLHLDMRFLFDSGKTKGQDLWQYHQNEKNYSHSLSLDHRLQWLSLTSTTARQTGRKVNCRKSLSSNSFNHWFCQCKEGRWWKRTVGHL